MFLSKYLLKIKHLKQCNGWALRLIHLPEFLHRQSELTFNHDEKSSIFTMYRNSIYVFHFSVSPLSLTLFRGEKANEGGTTIHSVWQRSCKSAHVWTDQFAVFATQLLSPKGESGAALWAWEMLSSSGCCWLQRELQYLQYLCSTSGSGSLKTRSKQFCQSHSKLWVFLHLFRNMGIKIIS